MFLTLNRSALRGGDTTNVVSMFEVTDLYSVFEDTVFLILEYIETIMV